MSTPITTWQSKIVSGWNGVKNIILPNRNVGGGYHLDNFADEIPISPTIDPANNATLPAWLQP